MICVTHEITSKDLLQIYFAKREINTQVLDWEENLMRNTEEAEAFCRFLNNYFKINISPEAITESETIKDVISALAACLPEDKVLLYCRLMNLYRLMLNDSREELIQWHKEFLRLTRKLQKDVDEMEYFVADIFDD
ncbi:MAG: hypothetical protein IKX20_07065 [Paludibacteraceae bacterium]|nr:hypothetical protein [Paludibacteraceae bacterium]